MERAVGQGESDADALGLAGSSAVGLAPPVGPVDLGEAAGLGSRSAFAAWG
jgi:hypothetical protein